jgi:catechol 2,3-dioxygenase-like lactoylglutathione lyase family enzyme
LPTPPPERNEWNAGPTLRPRHLLGQIGRLLFPGRYLCLPVLGTHQLIAEGGSPEPRQRNGVTAVDDKLGEPASHENLASMPDRSAGITAPCSYAGGVYLGLAAIVVDDYDSAISFFVDRLGFELAEDSPALTNDGRPKRWVVVRPRGAVTGLLLARADGDDQAAVVGSQTAGRVGFFLNVEDFGAAYARMTAAGVQFLTEPRTEPYGQVAVFRDIAGNKWDLIGPAL